MIQHDPFVDATTIRAGRSTIAVVAVGVHGEKVVTAAEAIRHPEDRDNPNVGMQLAMARALRKAGQKLEQRANGYVKHADDMRAQTAKQRHPAEASALGGIAKAFMKTT